MGKHHDKIKKALEQRIAATPNGSGYKKPGSMNKRKLAIEAKLQRVLNN